MATRRSSNSETSLDRIEDDIRDLKDMVTENRHVLIGRDVNPGVIGNMAILRERLCALETLMSNDLKHLQARFDIMFQGQDLLQRQQQQDVVTKGEILKEWIKPIIVSIATAVLVYFIVTAGLAN